MAGSIRRYWAAPRPADLVVRCARAHRVRLARGRFWAGATCPKYGSPVDRWRVRRAGAWLARLARPSAPRLVPRILITQSATPPVVIVQADHGGLETDAQDRMAILNAYYLPGEAKEKLYPGISPVNSFRLVFNAYLGTNYPLLEDTSYFSKNLLPYKFTLVEETRPGCDGANFTK